MKYTMELTERQMLVVRDALEEWFRLRMGQDGEFSNSIAFLGRNVSKDNPHRDREFNSAIARRDHVSALMQAVFHIAFEPYSGPPEKTEDMMIAECIWDAMRFKMGDSRWLFAMQIGPEPSPKIETVEDDEEGMKSESD